MKPKWTSEDTKKYLKAADAVVLAWCDERLDNRERLADALIELHRVGNKRLSPRLRERNQGRVRNAKRPTRTPRSRSGRL